MSHLARLVQYYLKLKIYDWSTQDEIFSKVGKRMRTEQDNLRLRETGKGFIVNSVEGLVGRMLTKTFIDQHKRTYVRVNGELTLLTSGHHFLAAD
jgi:hypothetical protein